MFGKKPDPDGRRLAERAPEIQVEIERWFGYLRGEIGERPVMSLRAIMAMTSAEKQESQRLSALRSPE